MTHPCAAVLLILLLPFWNNLEAALAGAGPSLISVKVNHHRARPKRVAAVNRKAKRKFNRLQVKLRVKPITVLGRRRISVIKLRRRLQMPPPKLRRAKTNRSVRLSAFNAPRLNRKILAVGQVPLSF